MLTRSSRRSFLCWRKSKRCRRSSTSAAITRQTSFSPYSGTSPCTGPRSRPRESRQRRAATARITVVPGYSQLLDELEREESDALNFSVPNAESWVVENESDNGYGAMVPAATTDWIRVGELIGVQLEGSSGWAVALVRRVVRDDKRQYHVGIEIISRTAALVRISHGDAGRAPENAILLSTKPNAQGEVEALLRAGRFDAGNSLDIAVNDAPHLLMPSRMVEAGEDFDLAMYKVLRKDT